MSTLIAQQGTTDKTDGSVVDWIAHGGKPKVAKKAVVISMMAFAIMNVTTIVSLRGLPAQAEYGLTSIFYYVFAAVVFLVPVSLVAAELACRLSQSGRHIPLGWRGLRATMGLRRHLLSMAGDRHLVSDGADIRRRGARLYLGGRKVSTRRWPTTSSIRSSSCLRSIGS